MASGHAALQHRDFRLLQGARLLSIIGTQVESVAIALQVYALTKDPLALGNVGLAQFLPMFLLSVVGGQAADRFDRRIILMITHSLHALTALALLLMTVLRLHDVRLIYGVLVVFGCARAFSAPAGQALTPLVVPPVDFPNAVTWASTVWQIATIVGPALGGLLYTAGAGALRLQPATAAYAATVVCSLGALLGVIALRVRPGRRMSAPMSGQAVIAGFKYVWSQKLLLGSISLDLFAVLLGGAVALLPIYAEEILRVGPDGYGLLRAAPSMGAAAMAVYLAYHPLKRTVGHKLFICVAIFGIATIVFGLSRSFLLSLGALIILGAADMVSVVLRLTLEQLATPDAMRGRVSAVNMMFIGASNELGEWESGVTAKLLGPVNAVLVGGVGTLIVVGLWALLFPQLRRVDRLEDASPR